VLRSLFGQLVFTADGSGFFWEDVILAARAWGDWAALELEVRQGIACLRHAIATKALPSAAEVEAAANVLRAAAELRTAAQTQKWLADRGLTVDNWYKYLKRQLLRQRWSPMLDELVDRYRAKPRHVHRALKTVGICSGHLTHFARQLAGHAAVALKLRDQLSPGHVDLELQSILTRFDPQVIADGYPAISVDCWRQKLAQLACLQASFLLFKRQLLTDRAIQAEFDANHTQWVRIDGWSVDFKDDAAAREAICCVQEDGETLGAVAHRTNTALRSERFYLEALEPRLRPRFLAARDGDVLGPLQLGEEVRVFHVLAKVLPSASDADLRQRAERLILERAIDHEAAARVQWKSPW
jgi:hypothetical protein